VLIECGDQIKGDALWISTLDVVTRNEVHQFTVLEEGDRRAARGDSIAVFSGSLCRFDILACEHRSDPVGSILVLQ